jgi:LacI family transcriptional regulator
MEELNNKIRIKDIAKLAGVSEGTVDRVIHQRGDVSAKSLEAVNKVLEEINYTPNLIARSLASKKQYRFVCLYPQHNKADYWQSVDDGLNLAANEFIYYNVQIEKLCFNQYDAQSFIDVSNNALKMKLDAVFIAPVFREECLSFIAELKNRNIPFSFIDSMIEDTDFVTYYGQHSFQSGYIAAKLLLNPFVDNEKVLVIRTQRKGAVSNQTINRNNGFVQYIQDKGLAGKLKLIYVEFKDDDEVANLKVLQETFTIHTNIKAAITFNSKVYRLAKHLETLNRSEVKLIGYDLLEQNVAYLKQGVISCLIAQRPDKQAYFTVRDMCRELVFKQKVTKINYVPIDVLMKENIEYYLKFRE